MAVARIEVSAFSYAVNQNLSGMLKTNERLGQTIKSGLNHIKRVYLSSDLMRINYNDAYAIGLDEFDDRRRMITASYNDFNAELRLVTERVGSVSRLTQKAAQLVRQIGELFEFEEGLMAEIEFPECAAHHLKHSHFLETLHDEFERIQSGHSDMYDLSYLVGGWLIEHMRSKDKAFGAFIVKAARDMAEAAD